MSGVIRPFQFCVGTNLATFPRPEPRSGSDFIPTQSMGTILQECEKLLNSGGIPELLFQQQGMNLEVINTEFFAWLQQQAQP